MARRAPAGYPGGRRGRRAGRSLRKCRIHLRQEAPARNRSAGAVLRKRLEGMTIVDPQADSGRRDPARIYFGAWVQIESDRDRRRDVRWYRLVGPDEFDMAEDYISMDSPLGRSLLGKRLDDEVSVALPGGTTLFTVAAISYGPRP